MVSLLWKACSEGDLQKVQELLEDPNNVDVELKGESIYPTYVLPLPRFDY